MEEFVEDIYQEIEKLTDQNEYLMNMEYEGMDYEPLNFYVLAHYFDEHVRN
jgi:SMC interacting uncharacterized protein involved in chromosome segregation